MEKLKEIKRKDLIRMTEDCKRRIGDEKIRLAKIEEAIIYRAERGLE